MLHKFMRDEKGVSVVESLIIIALLCATALIAMVKLRGGASNAANTVTNRLNSFATGGSW